MTIIDKEWWRKKLRDIKELLEADNTLDITAANGESMPYIGWVEVTFRLASEEAPVTEIVVPTLVIKDASLARPIIGSNAIGVVVNTELKQSNTPDKHQLLQTVVAAFPGSETSGIQACVEQVSTGQTYDHIVKTTREKLNTKCPKTNFCESRSRHYGLSWRQYLVLRSRCKVMPTIKGSWPWGVGT